VKDLKHLAYFEELLQSAHNELVRQAKSDGGICVGYTCYHMPEPALNAGKCFSVRMRAPQTSSLDISTYYMSNYTCEFCRAILERSIEGGFNFLDCIAGVDACAMMNRCMENIELTKAIDKETFFVTHADIPYKVEDYTVEHYARQIRNVLQKIHDTYGADISDEALVAAVEEHNKVCEIISEIGELRKAENPVITGYEFHVLNLVSFTCPKALILGKLRETLEEIKTRAPDKNPPYRARVVIAGSEIDDLSFTKLVEETGALIVADRFCFGSTPGREPVRIEKGKDVLTQICRHYAEQSQCPRYMSEDKITQRRQEIDRLFKDYHADGIIFEGIKFCDFWGFERALASYIQEKEFGHPVLSLDRPYMSRTSGQLRTRVQAFVESLEIKRIQQLKEKAS
jgi:benzoyl-CoA reductase/2-hydroxyglutaryl-CoA dehydratase subunit BcrC/BadD/HgdB